MAKKRHGLLALTGLALGLLSTSSHARPAEIPGLSSQVLNLALDALECAKAKGSLETPRRLAIIDYSKPSTEDRLFVLDVVEGRLLFKERVAHGKGTGAGVAERFSNVEGSRMSSLGLFKAAEVYYGQHGKSLRLDGLEAGINDQARSRAIVMHGADYVGPQTISKLGYLGRSWGCPAVRPEIASTLIDELKEGSAVFAYYPDSHWLKSSEYLTCGG
jgi:hypothetical protein